VWWWRRRLLDQRSHRKRRMRDLAKRSERHRHRSQLLMWQSGCTESSRASVGRSRRHLGCRMARLEDRCRRDRQDRGSGHEWGQTANQRGRQTTRKLLTMLSSKSLCIFLLFRRSRNQTNPKIASSPTTPPTTPPAIAPTSTL
jgi:hypothetical protein